MGPGARATKGGALGVDFEVLFDEVASPALPMPRPIEAAYGRLGLPSPVLYANFVASVDGVVAFEPEVTASAGDLLSGRNPADRFLMGLLRACADAILVGAGTLRAERRHTWSPAAVMPAAAGLFAQVRERMGLAPQPQLFVASASGRLDPEYPSFEAGARVLTTVAGSRRLPSRLREQALLAGSGRRLDMRQAIAGLRDRGFGRVLTEGGPSLAAELLRADVLDELFLTVSPVLAGRAAARRAGLVQGLVLLPDAGRWTRLHSARRAGDVLFLRYGIGPGDGPG